MSNFKKIIGVVLALVMALSVATVAFAAPADNYTVTLVADKTELQAGETATVDVKLTTNFKVSAITIPVFFDNTKVTVTGVATATDATEIANTTVVFKESPTNSDVSRFYKGTSYTPADHGVIALSYIAQVGNAVRPYTNETVMKLTVTALEGVSGAAVVECLSETVKTNARPSGTLLVGKNPTADSNVVDAVPEIIDNGDVTGATTTITIAGAGALADLAVKSSYADSGIVIDTNKTFGGQYDGVVYGFTLEGTINAAFYTTRLEATNGGSITIVKTPYVARPVSYGTGATVKVNNADGTLAKTYVIVIFGDVSGNGKIGAEDTGAIYNHVQGKTLITDEVQVMAANLVESGRTPALKATSLYQIKADDTGAVYEAVQGTKVISQANLATAHNTYNTYYQ